MSKIYGCGDERTARYVDSVYGVEDDVLRDIRARSAQAGLPEIQVSALDGRHLLVLAAAAGAHRAVEIGTLGGYSGVWLLRGMADGGVLDTFEIDSAHARVAEETFRRAGFAGRVRQHLGPAGQKLREIESEAPFDLCFIDADKEGYPEYLDWAARHLRKGGLVIADNAFLWGELADPARADAAHVRALKIVHQRLATGGQWHATVLPTGEGLAVGVLI